MKITLRSANLIDLITSQGRLRFLATHTQSHLGHPGILKNKETLDLFLDNHSKFAEVLFTT